MRGDLTNLDVVDLSRRFGSTVILHNRGGIGTLRRAATDAGIPTVTLETGEPLRIQEREVRHGVAAIQHAMSALSMYPRGLQSKAIAPVYFESRWVRVNEGGVLMSDVHLGDRRRTGRAARHRDRSGDQSTYRTWWRRIPGGCSEWR